MGIIHMLHMYVCKRVVARVVLRHCLLAYGNIVQCRSWSGSRDPRSTATHIHAFRLAGLSCQTCRTSYCFRPVTVQSRVILRQLRVESPTFDSILRTYVRAGDMSAILYVCRFVSILSTFLNDVTFLS